MGDETLHCWRPVSEADPYTAKCIAEWRPPRGKTYLRTGFMWHEDGSFIVALWDFRQNRATYFMILPEPPPDYFDGKAGTK